MIQGRADDSRKKAAAFPANQAPVQIYCRRLPIQHRPEEVPKSTAAKFGHAVAGFLGIQLETDPTSSSVYEVSNAAIYLEQEPTVLEWIRDQVPSWSEVLQYFLSLFPFLRWISHYNVQWFLGDLIAGITVGAVVVPQGMAYAALAHLPPEFGLYSSFMGVLIYWFFATSKDITIGPVAVLSVVTGTVVLKAKETLPDIPSYHIASALGLMAGSVVCFLGIARLGWLVEFISLTAVSAFMTGSALNIAASQVPSLLGIKGISPRETTYKLIVNTLKNLSRANLNAAMGITSLFLLYAIRIACNRAAKRYPQRKKIFFFLAALRAVFVILLYTLISFLVNKDNRTQPKFRILGTVRRGFQHAEVPQVTIPIIKTVLPQLPVAVIVLLIEHISISKSFGRVNRYKIDPSQELVAIGVTNLLGPFVGSYPATGSFSRTAIQAKAGARTPFTGVITAGVVLLAIYGLTGVFFFIPNATLAAVIIHAVTDLITPPNTLYQFWRVAPLEIPIYLLSVLIAVFTKNENGIYAAIISSAGLLFYRIFKAKGHFLGRVTIHSVISDYSTEDEGNNQSNLRSNGARSVSRDLYLPVDHYDGSNTLIELPLSPAPGIFMFRFSEGYNYPNANHYLDHMVSVIFKHTRRADQSSYPPLGDRPWNDPGPRRGKVERLDNHLPTLKAVIIDFSSVNNVDVTSVQHMIDVRHQLDRYAAPDMVDWHFAHIKNRWTRRALAAAGFGLPSNITNQDNGEMPEIWAPIFSIAEIGGEATGHGGEHEDHAHFNRRSYIWEKQDNRQSNIGIAEEGRGEYNDTIAGSSNEKAAVDIDTFRVETEPDIRHALVYSVNRPFFHVDMTSALESAIIHVRRRTRNQPPVSVDIFGDEATEAAEATQDIAPRI